MVCTMSRLKFSLYLRFLLLCLFMCGFISGLETCPSAGPPIPALPPISGLVGGTANSSPLLPTAEGGLIFKRIPAPATLSTFPLCTAVLGMGTLARSSGCASTKAALPCLTNEFPFFCAGGPLTRAFGALGGLGGFAPSDVFRLFVLGSGELLVTSPPTDATSAFPLVPGVFSRGTSALSATATSLPLSSMRTPRAPLDLRFFWAAACRWTLGRVRTGEEFFNTGRQLALGQSVRLAREPKHRPRKC